MSQLEKLESLINRVERLSTINPSLVLQIPDNITPEEEINFVASNAEEIKTDLQKAMNCINEKLELVEKADLAMDIISYKLFETEHDFRQKVDELNKLQEKLLFAEKHKPSVSESVGGDASNIGMEIINIENEIQDVQAGHLQQVDDLKRLKVDMQQKYEDAVSYLDEMFENYEKLVDIYTNFIRANTPEEHIELIADQLEVYKNFKNSMEELKKSGWKVETEEGRLNSRMEALGIKVTKSFNFYTQSGELLTMEELKKQGLLDNISISWEQMIKNCQNETIEDTKVDSKEKKTTTKPVVEPIFGIQVDPSKLSCDSHVCRMRSNDVAYLKEKLGRPLTLALAEITSLRPRDPIHYLGHWLFKYRYNQEINEVEKAELDALDEERRRIAREKWHQFLEQEARAVLMDLIIKADEEVLRRELERIEHDMMLMQGEEEHQEDEEALNEEARDKFENY